MAQGIRRESIYRQHLVVGGCRAKQGKAAEISCSSLSHSLLRMLFDGNAAENLVLQLKVGGTATQSPPTTTESHGYCNRKPQVLQLKVCGYTLD